MQHVKDLFTLINLASGVLAVHFLLSGRVEAAGYSIMLGYLLGDLPDGTVARLLQTSNRFGSELDALVDHFVHVIVAGMVLYVAYRQAGYDLLGLFVFGLLVATATVRHARFAAASWDFKDCFCGLPRTVSGGAAVMFALSEVARDHPATHWVGTGLISVLALLNLAPIPYMTHRGARRMQTWTKVVMWTMLATPVLVAVFDLPLLFDVGFVITMIYALAGWIPVRPTERAEFRAAYARWTASFA